MRISEKQRAKYADELPSDVSAILLFANSSMTISKWRRRQRGDMAYGRRKSARRSGMLAAATGIAPACYWRPTYLHIACSIVSEAASGAQMKAINQQRQHLRNMKEKRRAWRHGMAYGGNNAGISVAAASAASSAA